jgi:hypothetical protein
VMKEITTMATRFCRFGSVVEDVALATRPGLGTLGSFRIFLAVGWGIASGTAAAFSVVRLMAGRRGGISIIWV